jgi:hypothetical protein
MRTPLLVALIASIAVLAVGCGAAAPTAGELRTSAVHHAGGGQAEAPFQVTANALNAYLPPSLRHVKVGSTAYIVVVARGQRRQVLLMNQDGRPLIGLPVAKDAAHVPPAWESRLSTGDRALVETVRHRAPFNTFITDVIGVRVERVPGSSLKRYFHGELHLSAKTAYPVVSFLVLPRSAVVTTSGFAPLVFVDVVMDPAEGTPLGTYSGPVPGPAVAGR